MILTLVYIGMGGLYIGEAELVCGKQWSFVLLVYIYSVHQLTNPRLCIRPYYAQPRHKL